MSRTAWAAVLFTAATRSGRKLTLEPLIRRNHWVQMCAQGSVLLYWGWYIRTVYTFLPLVLAQILFAFGVDALLQWSRRDTYQMSFGLLPIVLRGTKPALKERDPQILRVIACRQGWPDACGSDTADASGPPAEGRPLPQ